MDTSRSIGESIGRSIGSIWSNGLNRLKLVRFKYLVRHNSIGLDLRRFGANLLDLVHLDSIWFDLTHFGLNRLHLARLDLICSNLIDLIRLDLVRLESI